MEYITGDVFSDLTTSSLMDAIPDGIIIVSNTGKILAVNKALNILFGYEGSDLIEKNISELIGDIEFFTQYIDSIVGGDQTNESLIGRQYELLVETKEQKAVFVQLGINHFQRGKELNVIGIFKDISYQKRQQDIIDAERKELDTVLNTVLDGVITIDKYGVVKSFNPAAEKIFLYKAEEIIGLNIKTLMPSPYHEAHDGYLSNYHKTGKRNIIGVGREVSAKRKNGECFPIELGVNEMEVNGKTEYVGTIRDITERVSSQRIINNYINQLKRSNQELDDFAYIASHDLKEPIRGLANNASFLFEDFEDKLGDDGKRRINRIQQLCTRLEKLIDDLLYFSRLGRQSYSLAKIDIAKIITNLTDDLKEFLEQEGAKVIINGELPKVRCDSIKIREVFSNLIINAVKYNDKEEKIVEIGCDLTAPSRGIDGITIYVKDNGIGIEEKFYNDIFRIFKRLNSEDDTKRGNGVGLTFVKKIIEKHDGKIWVESSVGLGTIFYFNIKDIEL